VTPRTAPTSRHQLEAAAGQIDGDARNLTATVPLRRRRLAASRKSTRREIWINFFKCEVHHTPDNALYNILTAWTSHRRYSAAQMLPFGVVGLAVHLQRKGTAEMAQSALSHTTAEAEQLKRDRVAGTAGALLATVKTWHCTTFANCSAAANFLNLPPAQVAGEAFATDDDRGQITLFYFL
jgi:hypothetical protein